MYSLALNDMPLIHVDPTQGQNQRGQIAAKTAGDAKILREHLERTSGYEPVACHSGSIEKLEANARYGKCDYFSVFTGMVDGNPQYDTMPF